MEKINGKKNYFLEGSGTTMIETADKLSSLVHLQSANLELSASMQKVYGGESNSPVFVYQDEKSAKITLKNASMSMDLMASTQGVKATEGVAVFYDEVLTVGDDGAIAPTKTPIDGTLRVFENESGNAVAVADGKVDAKYAGQKVMVVYDYKDTNNVGVEVMSTSIPGYVAINYRSKAIKQKDGRVVRLIVKIAKARCDGSFKINMEHKNAFAPEAVFEIVDPEDGRPMVVVAWQDVTAEEA